MMKLDIFVDMMTGHFNNKEQFIAEEVKRLSEKISEIGHKIELAKNEHLKTIKELDAAFEDKKPIDYWNRKQEFLYLFCPKRFFPLFSMNNN